MTHILHIDTSTKDCSVALSKNNQVISFQKVIDTNSHASILTSLIQKTIENKNFSLNHLDGIAFSNGPGSYTGLRIGMSTAKGLCYALNKPLICVDTLLAANLMALKTIKDPLGIYISIMKSRKGEIFHNIIKGDKSIVKSSEATRIEPSLYKEYVDKYKIYLAGNFNVAIKDFNFAFKYIDSLIRFDAKNIVDLACNRLKNKEFDNFFYKKPSYMKL